MDTPQSNQAKMMFADVQADYDVVIIGSGPAGLAAAARAHELGNRHVLLEAENHASDTIYKYQKGKHVMAEPGVLPLRCGLPFAEGKREVILNDWNKGLTDQGIHIEYQKKVNGIAKSSPTSPFQVTCEDGTVYTTRTIILGIGLQGNVRKMGVPGESLPLVQYTLADPEEFKGETIIVIGAGDAGIENAIGLAKQNNVYLMNRDDEFGYCKDGNRNLVLAAEKAGQIKICYKAFAVEVVETGSNPPLEFVFDGKNGPYQENDALNPINVYGKHKMIAENSVTGYDKSLVLRITNVYGDEERGKNFISRIIQQCKEGKQLTLKLPIDQYANPTNAYDISRAMYLLVKDGHSGIFNIGGTDYMNRVSLALRVLKYFPDAVYHLLPTQTTELNQAANRPLLGGFISKKFHQLYPDFLFTTVDDYMKTQL